MTPKFHPGQAVWILSIRISKGNWIPGTVAGEAYLPKDNPTEYRYPVDTSIPSPQGSEHWFSDESRMRPRKDGEDTPRLNISKKDRGDIDTKVSWDDCAFKPQHEKTT